MFELKKTEGRARRGVFNTPHGAIETPFFMNVGTAAAIKGGISSIDLKGLKTQVELCNTYHLHLRPGDDIIYKLGGLHKFMNWDKPILTDSGGFQVFSLSKLRKIKEEGVYFASHIDGKRLFIGPEESMQIQSHLASTIAMAFDECIENPAPRDYVKRSVERTTRWLQRCKDEMARLNSLPETINKQQLLFGINQGGTYDDIRVEHMQTISEMDMDGYAIGGLAVGEPTEEMYHILDVVLPHAPVNKPRYLMGVGTPSNIIEGVYRGVDMFDCVMPSRNARHATIFTWDGIMHATNKCYELDERPLDPKCDCPTCEAELVHSALYGACNELQHLVAGRVAVLVVVVLEVVYVDEQNRHLGFTRFGKGDLVVDLALNGLTVVKLGEGVEACTGRELLLALLRTVDIQDNADDLQRVAFLVAEGRSSDKNPDVVAVDVLHTVLVVLELLASAQSLEVLLVALCVLLVELSL